MGVTAIDVAKTGLWACTGFMEGFIMMKSGAIYPSVLADQFTFANFVVLKLFIGAVGSSMLAQGLMALWAPEAFFASTAYQKQRYGMGRVVLGTGVLGAGMAVAGSGPTMFTPAVGAGVDTAVWLIVGGLAGALVLALADAAGLSASAKPIEREVEAHKETIALFNNILTGSLSLAPRLDGKGIQSGYAGVAITLGVGMLCGGILLEALIPFDQDVAQYGGAFAAPYPSSILEYPAWPPILAGAVMGLTQVTTRLATRKGKGTATGYSVIFSTLTAGKLGGAHLNGLQAPKQLKTLVNSFGWVLLGAVAAAQITAAPSAAVVEGFPAWRMALGGFLCIVGARFAGGCTCGHGVSGTSELSLESFAAAGAIFGVAIALRCIMVFGLGVQ